MFYTILETAFSEEYKEQTYLLYRVLQNISEDSDLSGLAHPHRSCDGLLLDRWIPLRLDDMHSIGNGQIETIAD